MSRARWLPVVLVLLGGGAWAEEEEAWNQTEVREQIDVIPTIFGDLRRPSALTAPALPLPDGWGLLRLRAEREAIAWDAATAPVALLGPTAGTSARTLVEDRREATLDWVQNPGTSLLSFELHVPAARDSRTGTAHLGDPEADLVVPLAAGRYAALTLVLGERTPVTTTSQADWILGHGTLHGSGETGCAELRGATGIGLGTLQVRARAEDTPHGQNTVATPTSTTTIADAYLALAGAVGLTWRVTTALRLGCEGGVERRRWRHRAGDPNLLTTHVTTAPLLGSLEWTVVPGTFLDAWAGADAANRTTLDGRQRLRLGAGVSWLY